MKGSRFFLVFITIFTISIFFSCSKKQKSDDREIQLKELLKKDSTNIPALLELGIYYHDKREPNKAIETFEKILQLHKEDPVALVYLGSSYTILADKSQKVEDKIRYLEKGTRIMDETVSKFPDNYTVRLVRGINSIFLPDMFGRFRLTITDFEYLLKDETKIPKKDLKMILEYLAKAYEKDNQPKKANEIEKRLSAFED